MKQMIVIFSAAIALILSVPAHAGSDSAKPKTAVKAGVKKKKEPVSRTFTGYLVDAHCAKLHKKDMATYIKTHTRECMIINGKGLFSLYMPDSNKIIPISREMSGCFQGYVEKFKEGLYIQITGYMRQDSIYSQMYKAVPEPSGALGTR